MSGYAVRRGPFEKTMTFRLSGGDLVQSLPGKPDKAWPLHHLRAVRIAPGVNRYVPDEIVLRLVFRKGAIRLGAVSMGSHSFQGLANYADQRASFIPFAREVCREAANVTPPVRFEHGAARAAGVFTGAMMILGAGVILLLIAALGAGAAGLGVDLAARLAFVLMVMLAVQPWLTGAGPRRFDPRSIPPDVLS